MKAVVQRVSKASVTIGYKVRGEIRKGLLILLGVENADGNEDIVWLAGKITRLRIFPNEKGIMNRSVPDARKELPVVSQFTLHANINSQILSGKTSLLL